MARISLKNVTYRPVPRHIAAPLVGGAACRPERKYPGPRGKTRNIDSLDASGLTYRRFGVETNAIVEEKIVSANGFSGWRRSLRKRPDRRSGHSGAAERQATSSEPRVRFMEPYPSVGG
jgi:hypothetical protein